MATQRVHVEHWDNSIDGVLSEKNMEKKLREQGYTTLMYTFQQGTNFPDHTHSCAKKDAILSGQFQFGMHGEEVILKPGDMVEVPADTVHNASVVGRESVVFFDGTKRR